jgi:uncharacterized small protein (DUF1192 family)
MVRLAAAAGVLVVSGGAAVQQPGVPLWLYAVGFILGPGVVGYIVKAVLDRKFEQQIRDATAEVKKTTAQNTAADTEAKLDNVRRMLVSETEESLKRLTDRTHEAEQNAQNALVRAVEAEKASAAKDAEIARLAGRVTVLQREIERLHDELARVEAGRPRTRRQDKP